MAAGRPDAPTFSFRRAFLWAEIFRTFRVAAHPTKLLVAAAGILAMSLGWFLLSKIFYDPTPPDRNDQAEYGSVVVRDAIGDKGPDGQPYKEADYDLAADRMFARDLAEWRAQDALAGPDGSLRTLPWYEYRGPNPYHFLTAVGGGDATRLQATFGDFLSGTLPVLVEPLRKLLVPVVKLVDPATSQLTRLYLLLCLLWSVVVWAFFGGVLTRLAVLDFTGKARADVTEAVRYVGTRYGAYVASPLVPVGVIAFVTLVMMVYAFVALIPYVGDLVLYGLGFPLVIIGGAVMVVLLIGLIGYPLMYTTMSTEGTDTLDTLSRAYLYVIQAPWSYLWYWTVAILYGAVVTFFVIFVGSLTVYLGKWAIAQAPLSQTVNRQPDYLFMYAPETFGWRQLFLEGGPLEQEKESDVAMRLATARRVTPDGIAVSNPSPAPAPLLEGREARALVDAKPAIASEYRKNMGMSKKIGAGMVSFWLALFALVIIGFSYSYFWCASAMIYLLMRKKVDDIDMDEVYVEEPRPSPAPIAPPATPAYTPPAAAPSGPPAPVTVPPPAPAYVPPPAPAVVPPTPVVPPYVPPVVPVTPPPPPPIALTPPAPPKPSLILPAAFEESGDAEEPALIVPPTVPPLSPPHPPIAVEEPEEEIDPKLD
jgi:hypothetical protein